MITPTTLWIVMRHYSDGSGEPELITAIPDEATAMAVKATHEASYGDIKVKPVPMWPVTQVRE